ncbi:hypothetical protein E2C01_064228 [Portunus trituberculatus]|uniref:Uncharacterized protein n=1 Tax=Portunus trituberculatus TaxID=210409 RepID=A0A5B7HN71_PORTR|nr:hypothetical protein [Portunus trituberculatus]
MVNMRLLGEGRHEGLLWSGAILTRKPFEDNDPICS